MGAWLLFLIVLATFKPIVQVASTDETSPSSVSKSKLFSYSSVSSTATITTTSSSSSSSPTTTSSLSPSSMLVLPSPSPSPSSSPSTSPSLPFPVIDNFNSNNKLSDSVSSDHSSENSKLVQEKTIVQMEANVKNNDEQSSTVTFGDGDDRSDQSDVHGQSNDDNDIGVDNQVDSEITTTINNSNNDINYSYSDSSILTAKKPDPDTLVEIENSLLSLFNMKRPPKIDRSKVVIPEAMKKLYAQIMGEEIDSVNIPKPGLLTKSANTVRSFTHQDSKIDDRFPHHHRFRLHFEVNTIPAEEKLKAAELSLSRNLIRGLGSAAANRSCYQVLVYDILKVGIKGKREPTYLLLDSKQVRLNSTEVVSFDVQPAVDRWLATPKNNYGLLIEVRTTKTLKPAPHHHIRLRRSANETPDEWAHKQPLLFTYTDDGRHKSRSVRDMSRPKRAHHSRKSNRRKNNDEICRRHSLYVDFTDVGWSDWIVAPPGYDAYYCHGKCPFPLADHLNTTNHAVIQTLVNNIHPGKVPKPCCVPTQLTGISMLYLNEQKSVVLKSYQDMTVVGCGCR